MDRQDKRPVRQPGVASCGATKSNVVNHLNTTVDTGHSFRMHKRYRVGPGRTVDFVLTATADVPTNIDCTWSPDIQKIQSKWRAIQQDYEKARELFMSAVAARLGIPSGVVNLNLDEIADPPTSLMRMPGEGVKAQFAICGEYGQAQFQHAESLKRLNAIKPGDNKAFFALCGKYVASQAIEEGHSHE